METDEEVQLDFAAEDEGTWEEGAILEQEISNVTADSVPGKEEFLSDRHSPLLPIVARRLVNDMNEDDIANDRYLQRESNFPPTRRVVIGETTNVVSRKHRRTHGIDFSQSYRCYDKRMF